MQIVGGFGKGAVLALFAVFVIFIWNAGRSPPQVSQQDREWMWIERGKDAVKVLLKDAGSAEFRSVYFRHAQGKAPVSCGEVNAKNSFGGYSGFQRYISAGSPENTFLEERVTDFDKSWAEFCAD
jgi:hypothetical protein